MMLHNSGAESSKSDQLTINLTNQILDFSVASTSHHSSYFFIQTSNRNGAQNLTLATLALCFSSLNVKSM